MSPGSGPSPTPTVGGGFPVTRVSSQPATTGRQRPRIWGVLGGIGSGKSSAAALLAGPAGRVLDADAIAHEVLASPEVIQRLVETFGPEVLDAEGRPDRAVLAARVFRDPEARRALEGWTHPRVRAIILERLEEARAQGVSRIVLDVPLLLENDEQHGFVALCDALIFVDCSEQERERRVRRTRNWAPGELARRQAAQLPLSQKLNRADYVLSNEGSPQELEQAVRDLLERIEGDAHT